MKRRTNWRALAAALAERLPVERLHRAALEVIRAEPRNATIAIACSGGADSVALVLALWAHLPAIRGRMLVLHFNHRLRGRAAGDDARFVRALARGLGERCAVGVWRKERGRAAVGMARKAGPAIQSGGKLSHFKGVSEEEAREARLAFFAETMRAATARVITLGHQRDDVAETMLMRLARGSGSGGLAAPRPVQRHADGTMRVRPLLDVPAREIRSMLRAIGAAWREDATNAGDTFFRNRVRRRVLPALVAASPQDALAGFGAARAQLEEDDDALRSWLAELAPLAGVAARGQPFDVRALAGRPRALARRAVHAWLANEGLGNVLSRSATEQIIDAVSGARASHKTGRGLHLSAGAGCAVVFADGALRVERVSKTADTTNDAAWPEVTLRPGKTLAGPRGDRLTARLRRLTRALRARIVSGGFSPDHTVFLDPGADWPGFFVVRSWRTGDRYRPLGAPGRAKLQDLFVNRKVPRELRRRLPVVCSVSGTPCWVPGLPPEDAVAVQPGSNHVVQLTYLYAGAIVAR